MDHLDADVLQLSTEEVQQRTRMLRSQLEVFRSERRQLQHAHAETRDRLRVSEERITRNKRLPYLVGSVVEVLKLAGDEEIDPHTGRPRPQKARHSVVVNTTTRQTIFLPVAGFVTATTLRPSDIVGVDKSTFLILECLPKEYDSRVKSMEVVDRPTHDIEIGGMTDQLRELEEAIILPLTKPELFERLGIESPKGVLLHGPPGTGKTMMARYCAAQTQATFLHLAGPQLVQMYIGEGARMVRDAFDLAQSKRPAIIFIDEVDAIGRKRGSSGPGNRETTRTMLELLNQLDGFSSAQGVRVIAATNRPEILDPALCRSGRLDRKVEFPHPDTESRRQILQIHSRRMTLAGDVNFDELARTSVDFNGAQLRAVCVEAGMIALRRDAAIVTHEDFVEGITVVLSGSSRRQRMFYL